MIKFIKKELGTEKILKKRIMICNTPTTIISGIMDENKYPSVINKKEKSCDDYMK